MQTRVTRAPERLLLTLEGLLRLLPPGPAPQRPDPARGVADAPLSPAETRLAGRLMRVNHAGEVAAQGLYLGQALTARDPAVYAHLQCAASEENDHLHWCRARLRALRGRRSLLDPLWFGGAVAIGALAGLAGDARSLGFVMETERQVEAHLHGHLERWPAGDARSRAVIEQMRADEARHGAQAQARGGRAPPFPVPLLMRLAARVMTRTAHYL